MLENLLQDARHGLRLLFLNPGFTLVATLSLALGIGANTAIFQLLDAVRLRTLPIQRPEELATVRISPFNASGNFYSRYSEITNPQWEQVRAQQQGFSGMFAWGPEQLNLARGGEIRLAKVLWISGEFFDVLGVKPQAGRLLTASDDRRGCAGAAVISDAFWRREFGGSLNALQNLSCSTATRLASSASHRRSFSESKLAVPSMPRFPFVRTRSFMAKTRDWTAAAIGGLLSWVV